MHLVGGIIGTLMIGFLASDSMPNATNGLFYGGGFDQLWKQAIAAGAVVVYSFVVAFVIAFAHQEDDGHPHLARGRGEGYRRHVHRDSAYELAVHPDALTPTGRRGEHACRGGLASVFRACFTA